MMLNHEQEMEAADTFVCHLTPVMLRTDSNSKCQSNASMFLFFICGVPLEKVLGPL